MRVYPLLEPCRMSDVHRQIMMPGEAAQPAAAVSAAVDHVAPPARKKPGPKPRVTTEPHQSGDDLAEFETDNLPDRPAAVAAAASLTPDQMLLVQQLVADGVRAAMSSRDPRTAVDIAAKAARPQRLPSPDEARAMCEDMVARNIRPRAILTADGWYTHPEMARVRDHGVARLRVD